MSQKLCVSHPLPNKTKVPRFLSVFFQTTITSICKQQKMVFVLLHLVVAKYISSTFLGLRRPDDWYWFATLCHERFTKNTLFVTQNYFTLRHKETETVCSFSQLLCFSQIFFLGQSLFPTLAALKTCML